MKQITLKTNGEINQTLTDRLIEANISTSDLLTLTLILSEYRKGDVEITVKEKAGYTSTFKMYHNGDKVATSFESKADNLN